MKILVVCHGNINRSPLAWAIMRSESNHKLESAGFKPGGSKAAKKLRDWAELEGWPLESHRPSQIDLDRVEWADRVVLMDGGNYKRFKQLFPNFLGKVRMLGDYADVPRIPDPGFMSRADPRLHQTYELVVYASKQFLKALEEKRA